MVDLLDRATPDIRALAELCPEFAAALPQWRGAVPPFVIEPSRGGEVVDLVSGTGRYYGRDGRAVGRELVQRTLEADANVTCRMPLPIKVHGRLHDLCREILRATGSPETPQARPSSWSDGWSRLLLICGTGLGHHIWPLIERLDPRYVVVYEPNLELLYCASLVVPWRRIADRLSGSGRGLLIVSGVPAVAGCERVIGWLRRIPAVNFDGARWIQHNADPAFELLQKTLALHVGRLNRAPGYFLDERRQLVHTLVNLRQAQGVFAERRPASLAGDLVVIGSGPSLDEALPLLERLQHRAIVFSCGTGLTPLMRVGIRPDFHIELETSSQRYALASTVQDPAIFAQTTLIASNGYYPHSLALFQRRLLFLRPFNFAALALRRLAATADHAVPTVTNAAVALGYWLGFRRIHAFGLDLGYHDASVQHSRKSLYYDEAANRFHPSFAHIPGGAALRSFYPDSPIEIEDNQGGRMRTNDIFHRSLIGFEDLLQSEPINLVQCGLGARIRGSTARPIGALDERDFACDKAATIAAIHGRFRPLSVGPADLEGILHIERAKLDRVLADVNAMAGGRIGSQSEFFDRADAVASRLLNAPEEEESTRTAVYGDFEKFTLFVADLARTAGEMAVRRRLWDAWQSGISDLSTHMRNGLASVVPGEGVDPIPGSGTD